MKFGKFIASQAAGSPFYMEYKGLKKIIAALEEASAAPRGNQTTVLSAAPPVLDSAADTQSSPLRTAFFFSLERELEKVNRHYVQRMEEFERRLGALNGKRCSLMDPKSSALTWKKTPRSLAGSKALRDAYSEFQHDLAQLEKFVQINEQGFRKILKKFDKRAKSATKDVYLSRQVQTQPCFNASTLSSLTDSVARQMAELEHFIESFQQNSTETGMPMDSTLKDDSMDTAMTEADALSSPDDWTLDLQDLMVLPGREADTENFFQRHAPSPGSEWSQELVDSLSRLLLEICGTAPLASVLLLLDRVPGINVDTLDDISQRSCLHVVAINGRSDVLELIFTHGSVSLIDMADVYGRKPIHYAALHGHAQITRALLEHGISFKQQLLEDLDHDGASPLIHAVSGGHIAVVELLLSAGAKLQSESPLSTNPLSIACTKGSLPIAALLLARGARFVKDSEGLDPLHLVCQAGHSDLASLLLQHGADREASDNAYGWQPIFFAASEGHLACTRVLLKAGCQSKVKDESGWTPRTYAMYHGHVAVAQLFATASETLSTVHGVTTLSQNSRPIGPSSLFGPRQVQPNATALTETDILDDNPPLDAIPSLSLPPPVLPFRVYGHNYLNKKVLVQVHFGSFKPAKSQSTSPVRLFGSRQLSSFRLSLTCPSAGAFPQTLILPVKDLDPFHFMVSELSEVSLDFKLYPTYGTQVIGTSVVLPSIISQISESSWTGAGEFESCVCPLFDSGLKVVGELAFDFAIVKPFEHANLQVGGTVETYWKSTMPVSAPSSKKSIQDTTGSSLSFVTASSLSEEYLQVVVQITRDGIPVVYPHWFLPFSDFPIDIASLTFAQAKGVFDKSTDHRSSYQASLSEATIHLSVSELAQLVYMSFLTLEELLTTLPKSTGMCISIKYPTSSQRSHLNLSNVQDINSFVDKILTLVYDTSDSQRAIIFSSFNPSVCSIVNWKQPNYGVFFGTHAGFCHSEGPWRQLVRSHVEKDIRCNSIKEAVRFAKGSHLLGLLCEATPLVQIAALVNTIKESGLILATCGPDNEEPSNVRKQEALGVDAIILRRVLRYNVS